jgi:predicted nuclease of predicted toxin-antitoxin system
MPKRRLRLLVDTSLGLSLEDCVRNSGHDAAFVRDIDPRLPDSAILGLAVRDQRMVVTMDKDFGELVYRVGRGHHGVLLLRMEDQSAAASAPIVARLLEDYCEMLENHFAVYQGGRLRIRD